MADKDHLFTTDEYVREINRKNKILNSQQFAVTGPAGLGPYVVGTGLRANVEPIQERFEGRGNPIKDYGVVALQTVNIDFDELGSQYNIFQVNDDISFAFNNFPLDQAMPFIFDIELTTANPTITYPASVKNLPTNLPTASGSRYDLLFWGVKNATEERFYVIGGEGVATIPSGTADFQHLEWDNVGLKWDALDSITMQNVTGLIKWKNAAVTEEATLSVTALDNFLWTDFTTGAPHTMTFSGLLLRSVGDIRSGNIPTPSVGFMQLGNTDNISWRNAGNTNDAGFEFNASDKFEFSDLAAGGILATIDSTELDLKIGGLLLTMANNRAIQFRNAVDTEFGALSLSGSNNFTWVDPPTGSPHIMFFDGMLLQSIGELRSDNIPVPSLGFIKMGNNDELTWRNVGNTNDATFGFNSADKFEFTDLAAGGILATIDDTELDLKIGGLLLTMGNNKVIQFRNFLDTEYFSLSVSASNNFTWVDATTGAPHDMFMGGLQIKNIGFLESGNVPTATGGFINMGNSEGIQWRNSLNTFDVEFEFSGADNFVMSIAGTIEWELDGISMDIDAKYLELESIASPGVTGVATTGRVFMDSGNSNHLSIIRNASVIDLEGAGAQTPWTSDIDADGFDLTDLSNIEFRDTTGAPGAGVRAIWADSLGISLNFPTSDTFEIFHQGSLVAFFTGTSGLAFDIGTNEIRFDNTTRLLEFNAVDNGIRFDMPTGEQFNLEWLGALQYDFSETEFDLHANNMARMGTEIKFNSASSAIVWPVGTAPNETQIFAGISNMRFKTGSSGDEFIFTQVTTDLLELNSVEMRIIDSDLEMDLDQEIRWNAAVGGAPRIIGITGGDLEYEVAVVDRHRFRVGNSNFEVRMTESLFELFGNFTLGMEMRIFRDDAIPNDNDIIGFLSFDGRDSVDARTTYAEIIATILDVTNGTEDGRLELRVASGGGLVTGLVIDGADTSTIPKIGFRGAAAQAVQNYTVTNPTTNRSLDVSGATLDQLRQVVGTILQDFIDNGMFQ